MRVDYEVLNKRNQALRGLLNNLVKTMTTEANKITQTGTPPSDKLLNDVKFAQEEIGKFIKQVLKKANEIDSSLVKEFDNKNLSLEQVEILIVKMQEIETKKIKKIKTEQLEEVTEILRLAGSIVYQEEQNVIWMQKHIEQVKEMQKQLNIVFEKDDEDEFKTIEYNISQYKALISILINEDSLDDDAYMDLVQTVTNSFDKSIVVAALKGKLRIEQKIVELEDQEKNHLESIKLMSDKLPETKLKIFEDPSFNLDLDPEESENIISDSEISTEIIPQIYSVSQESAEAQYSLIIDSDSMEEDIVGEKTEDALVNTIRLPEFQDKKKTLQESVETLSSLTSKLDTKDEDKHEYYNDVNPKDEIEENSSIIAKAILTQDKEIEMKDLELLLWHLIFENKIALAGEISEYMYANYSEDNIIPPWVFQSVALGGKIRYPIGSISTTLKNNFNKFSEELLFEYNEEKQEAISIMLASAALRPALLAPITGATTVLRSVYLPDNMNTVYQYIITIAQYSDILQGLDPIILREVRNKVAWQQEVTQVMDQVNSWWNRAPKVKISFITGAKIWLKLLDKDSEIGKMLMPVKDNDVSKIKEVSELSTHYSNEYEVKRLINYYDRKVLGRKVGEDLTGHALQIISSHIREAVGLARQWVDLLKCENKQVNQYVENNANKLKHTLLEINDQINNEIEDYIRDTQGLCLKAAMKYFKKAVDDIYDLFDPDVPLINDERKVEHILHAELIKIPGLFLNEEWAPKNGYTKEFLKFLLEHIFNGNVDWNVAFQNQCQNRDHKTSQWIIDYLKNNSIMLPGEIKSLEEHRENAIRQCRNDLRNDVEKTRLYIEDAVPRGLFQDTEQIKFSNQVLQIENSLETTLSFNRYHLRMAKIRDEIDSKLQEQITIVRNKMKYADIKEDNPEYDRIEELLKSKETSLACEYIDMIVRGEKISEKSEEFTTFNDFFPEKALQLYEFILQDKIKPVSIVKKVRDVSGFSVINMQAVAPAQAKQAADMLESWYTVKKARKIDKDQIWTIFTHLGFKVDSISLNPRNKHIVSYDIVTEPIADKNRCPLAYYGSRARGNYRLLCVWDRPIEETLINEVGDTSHGVPVIVFHFGMITERRRRDLATVCRERRKTFITIDDILMLYLCGVRGDRLPVLFACTLPFTYFSQTYITSGGDMPVEMFYGREDEKREIMNPDGSCFIYGGRQLGKTVLLREVQKNYHKPNEGQIAIWVDLKDEGIGYNLKADEIWPLLIRELKKCGVVVNNLPLQTNKEKLIDHIQKWLDEDSKRRIIIMLDEADRFLAIDEKDGFPRSQSIKGFMQKTEKRLKIVFAGLHNVQRTTRDINQPLAQFGTPICIGPLLENGQWKDARNLIKAPLASMGFKFESENLITRILSQTNYYPSLIQIYCNQLLQHVQNNGVFDNRTSPPYIITAAHVRDAYHRENLKEEIRKRFSLTLELDERYSVIAHAIALYCLTEDDIDDRGFSLGWIREQALTWWADGFKEKASQDSFKVLLDEMVGLGILRQVSDGYYTLRSPNVARLIGSEETITMELEKTRQRKIEFDATTFRSVLRTDHSDVVRRSPITAEQESELLAKRYSVSIVTGNETAGLNELDQYLYNQVGKEFFLCLQDRSDINDFRTELENLNSRTKNGLTVILVDYSCAWSEKWIEIALSTINKLKSKDAFVNVIFLADPPLLWGLINHSSRSMQNLNEAGVRAYQLGPWHDNAVDQWLTDCGSPMNSDADRARVAAVTANWPELLYLLYNKDLTMAKWDKSLNSIEKLLGDSDYLNNLMKNLGLELDQPWNILKTMSDYGEYLSIPDLTELTDKSQHENNMENVTKCIQWADMLCLVTPGNAGTWAVNPIVKRVANGLAKR